MNKWERNASGTRNYSTRPISLGLKDDSSKLRMDLIPVYPLRKLAEVYTIGAKKYADRNWEKGIEYSRLYGAMLRHLTAWWGGEQNDPEDGQHHLASVVFGAFALMEYERTHGELDNRPKTPPELPRQTYAPKPLLERTEMEKVLCQKELPF
jgi:hypothetical protein